MKIKLLLLFLLLFVISGCNNNSNIDPAASATKCDLVNGWEDSLNDCHCNPFYELNPSTKKCVEQKKNNINESTDKTSIQENQQKAFIKVNKKDTYSRSSNNAFYFTGTTSNNCNSIIIDAVNTEARINDLNYELTTYKKGDTTFKYGVREDFLNLGAGTTTYTFTAYCDDNPPISDTFSFSYNPPKTTYVPVAETKTVYVPVEQPKTIYVPVYGSNSNVIETSIDGEFEGWDGETIFKMMDGSIWQQDEYAYEYDYAYNPDVMIYMKNGDYYMKVEDVDNAIRVVRLN